MTIEQTVKQQREYFATGQTLPYAFRREALAGLRQEILLRQDEILQALQQDLGKLPFEGYMTEVGLVLSELSYIEKHLKKWMRDRRVPTAIASFPGKSFVRREPYGVALVMAPWNYPFLLSLDPLIGALAAGNCVVLKPSAYAPATSAVLRRLCKGCFSPQHVAVVEGGRAENTQLLQQRFDYIFFTGSVEVGKLVMETAAKTLTPVTLELGGKSPCIVDASADVDSAARRIVFGKYLNAGQTCVAPDYLLVQRGVKAPLVAALQKACEAAFGPAPLQNPELPKIINQKHFERLLGLMQGEKVLFGGGNDGQARIEPTLLDDVSPQSAIMQEEIFGPILPVLVYDELSEAIAFVNAREKPLALYLFTQDSEAERQVLARCSFGGGCVNDTIMHMATSHMGFGGVGHSGMGSYHGKKSFETFSHEKSLLKKGKMLDIDVRYHPYSEKKERLIRRILR